METLKAQLNELQGLKSAIESNVFQDKIMKPIFKELDKQKNAYDCESLRELSTIKGKKYGLKFILKTLKSIDQEIKDKIYEIEQLSS
jgi:hypothetical protein